MLWAKSPTSFLAISFLLHLFLAGAVAGAAPPLRGLFSVDGVSSRGTSEKRPCCKECGSATPGNEVGYLSNEEVVEEARAAGLNLAMASVSRLGQDSFFARIIGRSKAVNADSSRAGRLRSRRSHPEEYKAGYGIFAVFDGHGFMGETASAKAYAALEAATAPSVFCNMSRLLNLTGLPRSDDDQDLDLNDKDVEVSETQMVRIMDVLFLAMKNAIRSIHDGGTTASLAIWDFRRNVLYTGSVGDSPIFVGKHKDKTLHLAGGLHDAAVRKEHDRVRQTLEDYFHGGAVKRVSNSERFIEIVYKLDVDKAIQQAITDEPEDLVDDVPDWLSEVIETELSPLKTKRSVPMASPSDPTASDSLLPSTPILAGTDLHFGPEMEMDTETMEVVPADLSQLIDDVGSAVLRRCEERVQNSSANHFEWTVRMANMPEVDGRKLRPCEWDSEGSLSYSNGLQHSRSSTVVRVETLQPSRSFEAKSFSRDYFDGDRFVNHDHEIQIHDLNKTPIDFLVLVSDGFSDPFLRNTSRAFDRNPSVWCDGAVPGKENPHCLDQPAVRFDEWMNSSSVYYEPFLDAMEAHREAVLTQASRDMYDFIVEELHLGGPVRPDATDDFLYDLHSTSISKRLRQQRAFHSDDTSFLYISRRRDAAIWAK